MTGEGQDWMCTGKTSILDLTLVSRNLAGLCEWDVLGETSVRSDHFPVSCSLALQRSHSKQREILGNWVFSTAKWEMFNYICETEIDKVDLNEDVELIDKKVRDILSEAANKSISRSKGRMKRKAVPWWTEERGTAVKERNKALRVEELIIFRI